MVGNTHNVELEAAMLKELPHRRAQTRARPDTAETASEVAEAFYEYRRIEGATKRTANKCCRGLWRHIDRLIHCRNFGNRDPTVHCI